MFFTVVFLASNVSPMSAGMRHCEDHPAMDVKMFIPYDSAKLCINQVCWYYSLQDYFVCVVMCELLC